MLQVISACLSIFGGQYTGIQLVSVRNLSLDTNFAMPNTIISPKQQNFLTQAINKLYFAQFTAQEC